MKNPKQQMTTVCFTIYKGLNQGIRNQENVINNILSTDKQSKKWINQEVKVFLRHYVNYQQDNWTEWLVAAEFQYNDKKYIATERTSFKLNFGQHLWKGNLSVKTELSKLENFLDGLQRSWQEAKKLMEIAKEAMKRQFDKKRRNPQELKTGDNM